MTLSSGRALPMKRYRRRRRADRARCARAPARQHGVGVAHGAEAISLACAPPAARRARHADAAAWRSRFGLHRLAQGAVLGVARKARRSPSPAAADGRRACPGCAEGLISTVVAGGHRAGQRIHALAAETLRQLRQQPPAHIRMARAGHDVDGEQPAAGRRAELPVAHLADHESRRRGRRLGHQEVALALALMP